MVPIAATTATALAAALMSGVLPARADDISDHCASAGTGSVSITSAAAVYGQNTVVRWSGSVTCGEIVTWIDGPGFDNPFIVSDPRQADVGRPGSRSVPMVTVTGSASWTLHMLDLETAHDYVKGSVTVPVFDAQRR